MKLFSIFAIIVLTITNGYTQSIENIRTTSDNQKVIIEYDLLGADTKPVYVSIKVKVNNSKTITPQLLSGDVESVKTGKNKRIEWLALKEIGSTDASIEVSITIQSSRFHEVKIGTQVWMVENLNVERFRNGEQIPEAKTKEEWMDAGRKEQPAWCYYDNDPANGEKYGKLYNWYAINDPRGLAPEGWHIPSDKEWTTLIVYLGGEAVAGGKMKSTSGWNYKGNGNNSSSFSGLPGGHCNRHGSFNYFGKNGYWWSATESLTDNAWDRVLHHGDDNAYRNYYYKSNGFSVRCLND